MTRDVPPEPVTPAPAVDLLERIRLLQERARTLGFRPSNDAAAEKAFMDDLSGGI